MNFVQKERLKKAWQEKCRLKNIANKQQKQYNYLNERAENLSLDQQKKPTIWERIFIDALDLYGIQYEYQKSIVIPPKNYYVLDFYIPAKKLAIEIDGFYHFKKKQIDHDSLRTKKLREVGIKVKRFTNTDISKNLDLVMSEIFGKY